MRRVPPFYSLRHAHPMDLAQNAVSRNAAEFAGYISGRHACCPERFERLYPLDRP
jgi:hypothetical protein